MMNPPAFLLVDDKPDDVVLMERVFGNAKIVNRLQVARSGKEAILYLNGDGPYANRSEYPLPSVVLLDLMRSETDGLEVLRWIRRQPKLSHVCVVAITGADNPRQVASVQEQGADSLLRKPVDFERLVEISMTLGGYWAWLQERPEATHTERKQPQTPSEPLRSTRLRRGA